MASCLCDSRGYVRALEEDDFDFPDKSVSLAETEQALLGRCRPCDEGEVIAICSWVRRAQSLRLHPAAGRVAADQTEMASFGTWATSLIAAATRLAISSLADFPLPQRRYVPPDSGKPT